MKYYIFILSIFTFNSHANQSLIQVLEKNNVSTAAYETSGEVKNYSPAELKSSINNMLVRKALVQYASIGDDTETGMCLEQGIVELFQNPNDTDSSIFFHCGGIFDDFGSHTGNSTIAHQRQHEQAVILVKQLAYQTCNMNNQIIQIPVFTAPDSLVNIIHNLPNPNHASFHLSDGVTFHCIKPPVVLTHSQHP